ncbi:DUF1028 domain-containing protein [Aquicoccus porphyridii]|uniref:DUF1028 domain-containing protein n=1 Tax=Aquicoccus porphyridii TaxID=1852029 RepID=A0A5A9ZK55_9RHOB|nr:DUF1028 domain-containing protein [Aquicoccus porphyridii]KAA0917694.1 DUF1028 domain-containing protein [Aquicoccus porphyridii]RAI55768.1 DUF1028 domain-containing protein [Rhodobacteraceae bacterium AsT-22]
MTYSIIARDPGTGEIGVIVASRFFACGAVVPYVGRRVAVATQAFVNPLWGTEGRRRLEAGKTAEALLAEFAARDAGRDIRQCHMLDATGNFAAHTGVDCVDWAGHQIGAHHSVAGNMLAGPEVVHATFETYANRSDLAMPQRLLAAMRAGEDAGGDKRGRQAAGLMIHRGQDHAYLDLRADDHSDPLAELDRLLDVAGERYLHVADAMPTHDDFSGTTDRGPIDAAITLAEQTRKSAGRPSLSYATDPKTDRT